MTSAPIKLRITGGDNPHDTKIVDADTGRPVAGVAGFSIFMSTDRGNGPSRCHLVIEQFDYDLNVAATADRFGLQPAPLKRSHFAQWAAGQLRRMFP
jgi:hypothetical protein